MKKLMFAFLFVMPFCRAADDAQKKWADAIEEAHNSAEINLLDEQIADIPLADFTGVISLNLSQNKIQEIPAELSLPDAQDLNLENNKIQEFDHRLLERFPRLRHLNLKGNPLSAESREQLKKQHTHPRLIIEMDEFAWVKPAKKG